MKPYITLELSLAVLGAHGSYLVKDFFVVVSFGLRSLDFGMRMEELRSLVMNVRRLHYTNTRKIKLGLLERGGIPTSQMTGRKSQLLKQLKLNKLAVL